MSRLRSLLIMAAVFAAAGLAAADAASRPFRLVAHRGASNEAPENTLKAFEVAWQDGAAWAVETDLCLTRDKKVVCFHGPMKKITGQEGETWKMTLDEVRALDVGKWKGEAFAGMRVPTLLEALKSLPSHGHFVLELKIGASDAFCQEFNDAMRESGVKPSQITFISFNRKTLRDLNRKLPGYDRMWLYGVRINKDGTPSMTHDELLEVMKEEQLTGLNLTMSYKLWETFASKEFIQRIHDAGGQAFFFLINRPELAQMLYDRGADGITSDHCVLLKNSIKQTVRK